MSVGDSRGLFQRPLHCISDGLALGIDKGDGDKLVGRRVDIHPRPQVVGGWRGVRSQGDVEPTHYGISCPPQFDAMAGTVADARERGAIYRKRFALYGNCNCIATRDNCWQTISKCSFVRKNIDASR